jgi:hypothetical protein
LFHVALQHKLQHEIVLNKEQIMPNTSKSSKKATPATGAAAGTELTDIFTPLYLNSVAQVAELQKNSLDLAAEQTAEWIGAWKKAFSYFPVTPPTFVFDLAGQAVQTCVETQKSTIDLAVEQTEAVVGIAKQRVDAYSKITESVTAAFQTTVTRSVEAQKKVLDFAGAQNKAICEATKKQIGGGPASVIVDSFERGANTVIEAQKSILDATTKPFVVAAEA